MNFTFRIIFTTVIAYSLLRFANYYIFSAHRTFYTNLFQIRLCIPTFRESRTMPRNFPCGPYLITMFLPHSSQITSVTSSSIFIIFQFFFRFFHGCVQIRIEIFNNRLPSDFSFRNTVQKTFHICCKTDIHNTWE